MKISSSLFVLLALAGATMQHASAADGSVKITHTAETENFNPQPDPPREVSKFSKTVGVVNAGDAVSFNPQPDPPGAPAMRAKQVKPGVSNPALGAH